MVGMDGLLHQGGILWRERRLQSGAAKGTEPTVVGIAYTNAPSTPDERLVGEPGEDSRRDLVVAPPVPAKVEDQRSALAPVVKAG